jgi:hypothetical protein
MFYFARNAAAKSRPKNPGRAMAGRAMAGCGDPMDAEYA